MGKRLQDHSKRFVPSHILGSARTALSLIWNVGRNAVRTRSDVTDEHLHGLIYGNTPGAIFGGISTMLEIAIFVTRERKYTRSIGENALKRLFVMSNNWAVIFYINQGFLIEVHNRRGPSCIASWNQTNFNNR